MKYVSVTDKFMSGWGNAEGKTFKYIFVCDDKTQADNVANNLKSMKNHTDVIILGVKPRYDDRKFYIKTVIGSGDGFNKYYIKGYFQRTYQSLK